MCTTTGDERGDEPPRHCYGIYRQATIRDLLAYMSWRIAGLQKQLRFRMETNEPTI
jgi:hypothetical protein